VMPALWNNPPWHTSNWAFNPPWDLIGEGWNGPQGPGAGSSASPDSDLPYPNTFLMPLFGLSAANYEAFMA
jgi:hypothetical protein